MHRSLSSLMGVRQARARLADQEGQALILFAFSLVMVMGMAGFAIDYGRVIHVRTALQASTDMAAAAGAQHINVSGQNAATTATAYSALSGRKNYSTKITGVTMVSGYPALRCLSSSGLPQCPVSGSVPSSVQYNAIEVRQQKSVSMTLVRLIGISSINVVTRAVAGARGGTMPPLDVMIVVDTTGSMDDACGSTTRLGCAKAGVRTLLQSLWPCAQNLSNCGTITSGNVANPVDKVGLAVFPGLLASTAVSQEFDCSSNISTGEIAPYNGNPTYVIVPLSSDFKTSASTTTLNGAVSNLAKAVYWADGNSCGSSTYGIENPAGQGSYFAHVITTAMTTLNSTGRAGVQDVIIFVSDGDANAVTGGSANPCQAAVTAADAAASSGDWVYAIAYGAATSGGCDDDSSSITPYQTMQGIASSTSRFYTAPTNSTLTSIFQKIADDLTTTRIVSEDTP